MRAFPRLVAVLLVSFCALAIASVPARGQSTREGRLIVTVVDATNAVIPGATVTLVGLDEATKKTTMPTVKTSEKGIATFEHLVPGRYSVQGEFPGFQMGLLRDLHIRAGDNKHVMLLPLEKFTQSVTVGRDAQMVASDRVATFGTALTREQVDALSDDPDEMRRQLNDMAGPDATIRVDSFEGQQLPPKAQIKAIHITRDMFAAESHYAGGKFIDIITQPGIGPLRGTSRFGFYNGALDGVNPLIGKKGPAQSRSLNVNIGGSLIKDKSSFSLSLGGGNGYRTPNLYASTPNGVRAEVMHLTQPSDSLSVSGLFDYAITKDQTLRLSFNRFANSSDNQGVGAYDLPERAYSTENKYYNFRFQEAGPLGRRFFINTRFALIWSDSTSHSTLEAPTIIVNDSFTRGGAQRGGGTHSRAMSLQSDLDYVRGIHSWRMGIQIDGSQYRSDTATNYLGTYTFISLDAFDAGTPLTFTRRVGDPTIAYWNFQGGVYVQDDLRVSKTLTLSPGARFEAQTHLPDTSNIGPRFGLTWAPFKSGKTTLRASAGIFYDWLSTGVYEQTLRVDGRHQLDLSILNPSFPDPGTGGVIPAPNVYLLGADLNMGRSTRLSAGIDQKITKTINLGATYSNTHGDNLLVGHNLNAPVDHVRPQPAFANIIETVSAARSRAQSVSAYMSLSLSPTMPGATASGPGFSWRRGLGIYANYYLGKSDNNTDGAFSVPASGNLATEWGPSSSDVRHRAYISLNSNAVKNFSASISVQVSSGTPYTIRTGRDDNGDLLFNDRPPGVGRNTERAAMQWNSSGYFSYTLGFGKRKVPLPPGIMITGGPGGISVATAPQSTAPRYRFTIMASADNLTNHANYVGYSGNMQSEFFRKPTSVEGVRTFYFNLGFSF